MAAPFYPTSAASRFFNAPPGIHNVGMSYLWDQDAVSSGFGPAQNMRTGAWRPVTPEDYSDINISGLNVSVGAVAVTGTATISPAGGVLSISGNVTPLGATYNPTISIISATGQVIVPATAKSWAMAVISGSIWVDGVGPLVAGASLNGGHYDIRTTLSRTIAIGGTGILGSPTTMPCAIVSYEV